MLEPLVSLMSRFGACSARIRGDRHTHTDRHTDTQSKYRNPRCACAPRVNYRAEKPCPLIFLCVYMRSHCDFAIGAFHRSIPSDDMSDEGTELAAYSHSAIFASRSRKLSKSTAHNSCMTLSMISYYNYTS